MTSYAIAQRLNTRALQALLILVGAILAISCGMWQAVSPKWALAATLAILLTALAVLKMEAAIVFFALTAWMSLGPFLTASSRSGYEDGLYSSELMAGILIAVWGTRLILLTLERKKVPLQRSPVDLPLLCLVGVAVFSFISAQFTWDYRVPTAHRYYITQIAELGLVCLPVAVCLLISNCLKDMRFLKATYWSVLAVGAFGFCVMCPWIKIPFSFRMMWAGLLPVPVISFLYAYVLVQKRFDSKLLVAICMLAVMLVVQYRYVSWVVMWLSASVSLCAISWCRSKKLFAAVFCCVALSIAVLKADLFRGILDAEAAEGSIQRFAIWASCIKMTLARPLWGIGPDNFYPYYSHYYADVFQTLDVSSPHSNYFQILVQYGFLGLGAFLWFLYAGYRMLVRFYRSAAAEGTWEKTVLLGATGLFAGMACAAGLADYLFPARANRGLLSFGTTVYTWIVLGLAIALHRTLSERSRERSDDSPDANELVETEG